MPSIKDFLANFGWPEFVFVLTVTIVILGLNEWKNLFGKKPHDPQKEKLHTKE